MAFETPAAFETFTASETSGAFEAFGVSETSKFWVTVNRVCIFKSLSFSEASVCKTKQGSLWNFSPSPTRQMAPKFQAFTSLIYINSYLQRALTTSAQQGFPFL